MSDSGRAISEVAENLWQYMNAFHRGRANAIKQAELAKLLGTNTRVLQQAIVHLLKAKEFVVASACSKPMGVFIPTTPDEKTAYFRQLENRVIRTAQHMRLVRKSSMMRVAIQQRLFTEAP